MRTENTSLGLSDKLIKSLSDSERIIRPPSVSESVSSVLCVSVVCSGTSVSAVASVVVAFVSPAMLPAAPVLVQAQSDTANEMISIVEIISVNLSFLS